MKQLFNRLRSNKYFDLFCFAVHGIYSAIFYKPTGTNGFEAHLDEAIELYSQRLEIYAKLSQGKSTTLFKLLITSEKLLKPIARIFDKQGQPFNQKGINIIKGDFVSMDGTCDPGKLIQPSDPFSDASREFSKKVIQSFSDYRKSTRYAELRTHCIDTLDAIEQHESAFNVRLQMLKHVIESIGYGALNAQGYGRTSEGDTNRLAMSFLNFQILGLNKVVVMFDEMANKLHTQGVGILVNDLPTIPVRDRTD